MSTVLTGKASIDRPWLNYYPEPFKNVEVPKMTVEAFLRMRNQDQTKYAFEYYGRRYDYEWLWQQVDAAARALKAVGFKEGDRIHNKKYGNGTIEKILKCNDKYLFSIQFDEHGRKLLNPQLANIEPIN